MVGTTISPPNFQNNPAGAIPVYLGAKYYAHYNATTAGTQIFTGPGVLHRLVINTSQATGIVSFYDGVSTGGILLAVVTTASLASLDYGLIFATGLFMVISGTAPDITVLYSN